jgi:hypothetical protein
MSLHSPSTRSYLRTHAQCYRRRHCYGNFATEISVRRHLHGRRQWRGDILTETSRRSLAQRSVLVASLVFHLRLALARRFPWAPDLRSWRALSDGDFGARERCQWRGSSARPILPDPCSTCAAPQEAVPPRKPPTVTWPYWTRQVRGTQAQAPRYAHRGGCRGPSH